MVAVSADAVDAMAVHIMLSPLLLFSLFPVPLAATAVVRRRLAVVDLEDVVVVVALPLGDVHVDVDVDGGDGERLHVFVMAVVGELQGHGQQVSLPAPNCNHPARKMNTSNNCS